MQTHTLKEIREVPIAELKPADYNPRKWDKEAISQLSESMTRFGCVDQRGTGADECGDRRSL
jgi:hypothetical protein